MAEEDIIYGKNRHFFGGIEPSNLTEFYISDGTAGYHIAYFKLPEDTVIDGQVVCTVGGVVVRRKTDDYPVDEFDGELVVDYTRDMWESNMADMNYGIRMCSSDYIYTPSDTNYYYSFFPYSKQGVYNRNPANRTAVYAYDLSVTYMMVTQAATDGVIRNVIKVNVSDACEMVLCKSTTHHPTTYTDGTRIKWSSATTDHTSFTFSDNDVVLGETYYYSAFVRPEDSTDEKYIAIEGNRCKATVSQYTYLYGFDIDLSDSNPDTRVSYPDDVYNAHFTPVTLGFTTKQIDWRFIVRDMIHFMPKPCLLSTDGTVKCYLNPNDYSKDVDGNAADITSGAYNVMMEWPKIYTHREVVDGVYKFRCSDYKIDEDWECWSNYNINDELVDHFYTPVYNGCTISSKLCSVSGKSTSDITVSTTFSNLLSRAESISTDKRWSLDTLSDTLLIQDLLVMMAKTTDLRSAYGYGVCNGSTKIATGTMNTKGLFWGSTNTTDGVKVFGMENWWGNYGRTIAGLIMYGGQLYAKYTPGLYDGTKYVGYQTSYERYLDTGAKFTAYGEFYIRNMKLTPVGLIPNRGSGSSSTYWCNSINVDASGASYPAVIGLHTASTGGDVGPFTFGFTTSTSSNSNTINAAPSYR